MAEFDILLRAATVALALCAAIAIAWRPRRGAVAIYAACAVAGIAAFMIASTPGTRHWVSPPSSSTHGASPRRA
jgi:hypothetical protein